MGKQKIDRLLAQLQDNHQQDIQNAAAIFTVAQGAVIELSQREDAVPVLKLPSAAPLPLQLTKADLVSRYGHYNACRKAAKQAGISFSRTPRWPQLIAAFSYIEACQTCVNTYVAQNPHPDLQGVRITLTLDSERQ